MRFCTKCGKQLNEAAIFCTQCGQPVNSVIEMPESAPLHKGTESKPKKKKVLAVVLPIVIVVVVIAAVVLGIFIHKKNCEAYMENANAFSQMVVYTTLKDVGTEISDAYDAYSQQQPYNGVLYSSEESAVEAARASVADNIAKAKSEKEDIDKLYHKLMKSPVLKNKEMKETDAAVQEVYLAYCDLYDIVVNPISGSTSDWVSAFWESSVNVAKEDLQLLACLV